MTATQFAAPPVPSDASDFATFGAVHLDVTDIERALGFWRDLVGLAVRGREGDTVRLGAGDRDLVVLHPGAQSPGVRAASGLYHLALHVPSLEEFARVLARIQASGYRHYPTDHLSHLADYLDDPDGNGLELAFETPRRIGSMGIGPDGPVIIDAEGNRRSGRDPIDLGWLFAQLPGDGIDRGLAAGTTLGHLHLRVADSVAAMAFYRDVIGFSVNMDGSSMGMFDMSAGGTFPHRLACNTWESAGRPQRPAGTAGMRHFTLVVRSAADFTAILARLDAVGQPAERRGDDAIVVDPAGNRLLLTRSAA
ncbi:MAG TPA: VOC family protein [Pseudonocardiaceae bacterium]|nr:VOC family protein [Pseudonocardiaceae bacterium]